MAFGAIGQLHRGKAANLPCQFRVQITARIVRDARQMNNGIDACEVDFALIAYIALNHCQIRVGLKKISEPHDVECNDLMAGLEQLGDKNAALVTACTSQKNFHSRYSPDANRVPRRPTQKRPLPAGRTSNLRLGCPQCGFMSAPDRSAPFA